MDNAAADDEQLPRPACTTTIRLMAARARGRHVSHSNQLGSNRVDACAWQGRRATTNNGGPATHLSFCLDSTDQDMFFSSTPHCLCYARTTRVGAGWGGESFGVGSGGWGESFGVGSRGEVGFGRASTLQRGGCKWLDLSRTLPRGRGRGVAAKLARAGSGIFLSVLFPVTSVLMLVTALSCFLSIVPYILLFS